MVHLAYENVKMTEHNFPITVSRRESNQKSAGCQFHWHEQLEFYYIVQGGIELLCNGTVEWLYPGDIAFVNWCTPHKGISFLDDTVHYIIQIDLPMLSGKANDLCHEKYLSRFMNNSDFPQFIKIDEALYNMFADLVDEYEKKEFGYELAMKAEVFRILARLVRLAQNECETAYVRQGNLSSLELVKGLLLTIHEDFTRDISLAELSKKAGVCTSHLCRVFKKHTGVTITRYINQLRCNQAVSMMRSGKNVTDAAFLVGFQDYNYFSRIFKKIMGQPPSKYNK